MLLSFITFSVISCNKDDDSNSNKDPSICIDANEELMSCFNCCASNGFYGGELDLIFLTCECIDEEDEDPSVNPITVCNSAAESSDTCRDCCYSNDYSGYSWTSFNGVNSCQCFD